MRPVGNRIARLYGTAKTHIFEQPRDITRKNTEFRLTIDESGTYNYNAVQGISNYLRLLYKNEYTINVISSHYTINDTQRFSQEI